MTSRAYVFIDGLEHTPVICGIVELDPVAKVGKFRYGKSYLQRADAFPLDPLQGGRRPGWSGCPKAGVVIMQRFQKVAFSCF